MILLAQIPWNVNPPPPRHLSYTQAGLLTFSDYVEALLQTYIANLLHEN